METECCGTCKYGHYVRAIEDIVCDNCESVYYAARVYDDTFCEEFEEEDK